MEFPIKKISGKIGDMGFSYSMPGKSNLAIVQNGMIPLGAKPGVVYRNLGYVSLRTHGNFQKREDGEFEFKWDISAFGDGYIAGLKSALSNPQVPYDSILVVYFLYPNTGIKMDCRVDENDFLILRFNHLPQGVESEFSMPVVKLRWDPGSWYVYKDDSGYLSPFQGSCTECKFPKPKLIHIGSCIDKRTELGDKSTISSYLKYYPAGHRGFLQLQRKTICLRKLASGKIIRIKKWRNVSDSSCRTQGVFRMRYHFKGSRNIKSDWIVFWFSNWHHTSSIVQEL